MGQIEDANIDRRHCDIGLLSGREPRNLDRQTQFFAGARLGRGVKVDVEPVRGRIDGEIGNAERAAGHAIGRLVERTMRHDQSIGADAPAGFDRHDNFIVALA